MLKSLYFHATSSIILSLHVNAFFYSFFYLTFTFQLLDKPWSQVSSLLPPNTFLHFCRAGGSAFATLVDFYLILLTHALALFALCLPLTLVGMQRGKLSKIYHDCSRCILRP